MRRDRQCRRVHSDKALAGKPPLWHLSPDLIWLLAHALSFFRALLPHRADQSKHEYMNPVERIQCMLAGRPPDRPPLCFWHHFPANQVHGQAAIDAHLAHLEAFEPDFLKIMNDNGYPHEGPVASVTDLSSLPALRGDEPEFTRQLDLIADLARRVQGRVLMTTTVFNVWATLRRLVRPPTVHRPPNLDGSGDPATAKIKEFLREDESAAKEALGLIANHLAEFASRCIQAGADGIYMSVRDDWLDRPDAAVRLYGELVRPHDLRILGAVAGAGFNVLHVCGTAVDFRAFAAYPVQVINWADRAAGPSIGEVRDWIKPAICAGVDNLTTLPQGTPEDCEAEVADAIRQAGDRPIIIAPGCTYDPAAVPRENLEALCRAVRQ